MSGGALAYSTAEVQGINGLVQRLPDGKLARVDAVLVNGGGIRHAGIANERRDRWTLDASAGA